MPTRNFSSSAFLGTVGVCLSGILINVLRVSLADLWIGDNFTTLPYGGDNHRTYRTKGRWWLGVGDRLTDIGAIGPHLPSVWVGILGINLTHLPDHVKYAAGSS